MEKQSSWGCSMEGYGMNANQEHRFNRLICIQIYIYIYNGLTVFSSGKNAFAYGISCRCPKPTSLTLLIPSRQRFRNKAKKKVWIVHHNMSDPTKYKPSNRFYMIQARGSTAPPPPTPPDSRAICSNSELQLPICTLFAPLQSPNPPICALYAPLRSRHARGICMVLLHPVAAKSCSQML